MEQEPAVTSPQTQTHAQAIDDGLSVYLVDDDDDATTGDEDVAAKMRTIDLDFQDCNMGNDGARAVVDALGLWIAREVERDSVLNPLVDDAVPLPLESLLKTPLITC